jgi:predicted nuclease of predicted toxin-antitoxin system
MKFLLDQNTERRSAPFLRNLGHDVKVVAVDFPPDISDHAVLTYAYKEQRIVITNDKGELDRLTYVLEAYANRLNHFLVVTPTNVRVKKIPIRKAA